MKHKKIYISSRARIPERSEQWRQLKLDGWNIISSWINEDGTGKDVDFEDLWKRIEKEISKSDKLILYVEPDDLPLKGTFVEVGMALALRVPVVIVAPDVVLETPDSRPLGTWMAHPLVRRASSMDDALDLKMWKIGYGDGYSCYLVDAHTFKITAYKTAKDIAEQTGVSEGRISQTLDTGYFIKGRYAIFTNKRVADLALDTVRLELKSALQRSRMSSIREEKTDDGTI
jgi:hypothetical protein